MVDTEYRSDTSVSYILLCFNNCVLLYLYGCDIISIFVKHEQTQTVNATELSFIIQFDSQLQRKKNINKLL